MPSKSIVVPKLLEQIKNMLLKKRHSEPKSNIKNPESQREATLLTKTIILLVASTSILVILLVCY